MDTPPPAEPSSAADALLMQYTRAFVALNGHRPEIPKAAHAALLERLAAAKRALKDAKAAETGASEGECSRAAERVAEIAGYVDRLATAAKAARSAAPKANPTGEHDVPNR